MGKQRESAAKLAAVKRPLRLAHHRIEPAAPVSQSREQGPGAWPPLRQDQPGLAGIEELGDDQPVVRLDQRPGAGELPAARRLTVLMIFCRYPLPERKPLDLTRSSSLLIRPGPVSR
jgi:hypothetical protein